MGSQLAVRRFEWLTVWHDELGKSTPGQNELDLFHTQDEEVPIQNIKKAAEKLLDLLSTEQQQQLTYDVNAREWRSWSKPAVLLRNSGLRMDELDEAITRLIFSVIENTLSSAEFQKTLSAMQINGFLEELCNLRKVMNSFSYNFLLFGAPSIE